MTTIRPSKELVEKCFYQGSLKPSREEAIMETAELLVAFALEEAAKICEALDDADDGVHTADECVEAIRSAIHKGEGHEWDQD